MEVLTFQQCLQFRQAELSVHVGDSNFRKIFKISAISAGSILLLGVFMFGIQNPTALKATTLRSSAASVPAAIAMNSDPLAAQPILGITIANNGSILVRGAKVTAISGNTIKTSVSWGSVDFAWAAETSGTTKFLNHQGQKQAISDVRVGDIVVVTGRLISNNDKFAINAEFVREQ